MDTRPRMYLAELFGTFIVVLIGAGTICASYLPTADPRYYAGVGGVTLAAALAECSGMPAETVVERVMTLATQWIGQQVHDDIAVVAITAPRRAHLSAVDGHTRGRFTA